MTSSDLDQVVPEQTASISSAGLARSFPLSRSTSLRPRGWLYARRSILHLVLIALSLTMLFPFLWTVSASLKGDDAVLATPPQLLPVPVHWENYAAVTQTIAVWQLLFNSLLDGRLCLCTSAFPWARSLIPGLPGNPDGAGTGHLYAP